MKTILTAAFIFFITSIFATDFPKKAKKERQPPMWDTLYHKNELSLNVSLPLSFLIHGDVGKGSLGLTYLRALTKRDLLRVSVRHNYEVTSKSSTNLTDWRSFDTIFLLPDYVITETSEHYNYNSPDIRIGYEHRFGKRRVKGILGMDVLFGAEFETTSYSYRYFEPKPITDQFGNRMLIISEIKRNEQNIFTKNINLKEGIAPFVGIFAHLSKRVSMRATMMYDVYWTQSVSFFSESSAIIPPDNQMKIGVGSLIADVSVTVHF